MVNEFTTNQMMITKDDLKQYFIKLGVKKGMLVLVQIANFDYQWVVGGAQSVIEVLIDILGYDGTLVIPSFTLNLKDPANLNKYNRQQWKEIRKSMMPFNKKTSSPDDVLARQFLCNEAVLRSYHPIYSFAAWGRYAKAICDKHPLHFGLGEQSPLTKIIELNGACLILGHDFDECVIFKHVQNCRQQQPIVIDYCPIESNHMLVWKAILDYEVKKVDFSKVETLLIQQEALTQSYLADQSGKLFNAKTAFQLANTYYGK